MPEDKTFSYSIIQDEETKNPDMLRMMDMIEKLSIKEAPSRFAVLGRYVITPDVVDILEMTHPGKVGEIELPAALRVMAQAEKVYA